MYKISPYFPNLFFLQTKSFRRTFMSTKVFKESFQYSFNFLAKYSLQKITVLWWSSLTAEGSGTARWHETTLTNNE